MTIEASKVQAGTVLLVGATELEIISAAPAPDGGTRVLDVGTYHGLPIE